MVRGSAESLLYGKGQGLDSFAGRNIRCQLPNSVKTRLYNKSGRAYTAVSHPRAIRGAVEDSGKVGRHDDGIISTIRCTRLGA
ncbi:hypothetical protein GCM10025871_27030 [Deinococcus metallilatus]|nr:hypothetical protein GCM10025871_27030 [Deinococcus metallilatus]